MLTPTIFVQYFSKALSNSNSDYRCSWAVKFTPEAQIADAYLWREISCALKASNHCDFDICFRTILLWLKFSLPVLPRPSLIINGSSGCPPGSCATNSWSEEAHSWVLKMKPRSVSSLPMQFLQIRLASDDKLLATVGRVSSTNLIAAESIFQESEEETFFIANKSTKSGHRPARSQVLSDIPKAWTYTWIRQESFPSEQECVNELFFLF